MDETTQVNLLLSEQHKTGVEIITTRTTKGSLWEYQNRLQRSYRHTRGGIKTRWGARLRLWSRGVI